MANGLLDPVYQILPNKIDGIRRSPDPNGLLGSLAVEPGRLTIHGRAQTFRRGRILTPGHLTTQGKVVRLNRTRSLTHGQLSVHGRSIQFSNAKWAVMPDFVVDRSLTFPQYVPNIRVNWLIDPGANVPPFNIALLDVNVAGVSYDNTGNDRIAVANNPGADINDVLQMQATTSTGGVILSNLFTLFIKNLSGFPTAGVPLFDAQGNAAGYGGNNDPEGVFYGMVGFAAADRWWAENVPTGATVVPFAGGSFTLTISGGMSPGNYAFDVVRWTPANGAATRTQKPFTVT